MFNDLNNPNNQGRQAVDDIFAETDRTQESAAAPKPAGGAEINTQRIGLAASEEFSSNASGKKGQDKLFKIIIIAIIVVVLGLAGYLVYSKFFSASANLATTVPNVSKTDVSQPETTVVTPASETPTGSFVEVGGNTAATPAITPDESAFTPLIPGVNAPPETTAASTSASTSAQASLVDSDSDGLTDEEERVAGTNINIIDTDNDGLSDYEEVTIYKTNPLSADTDGDGYLDGAEVKSGYNPNGTGKLSDVAPNRSDIAQ